MNEEYISEGIVLNSEPIDLDAKVYLLTLNFGKIICSVTSARKITSKLNGHIQPGNLVIARIVLGHKNNFKLVDVLKQKKLKLNFLDLYFLNKLLPELEPEIVLYYNLKNENFNWKKILKILGWDPKESKCFFCNSSKIFCFNINLQSFLCENCSLRFSKNELIYL